MKDFGLNNNMLLPFLQALIVIVELLLMSSVNSIRIYHDARNDKFYISLKFIFRMAIENHYNKCIETSTLFYFNFYQTTQQSSIVGE